MYMPAMTGCDSTDNNTPFPAAAPIHDEAHKRPTPHDANWEPIVGGSLFRAASGAIMFIIGVGVVFFSARRGGK